jgi:hypothetical protein
LGSRGGIGRFGKPDACSEAPRIEPAPGASYYTSEASTSNLRRGLIRNAILQVRADFGNYPEEDRDVPLSQLTGVLERRDEALRKAFGPDPKISK